MKNTYVKQVNRNAKALNRQIRNDVFGDRFEIRQYQKSRVDGIDYFLYELRDNEQPERNEVIPHWLNYWEICRSQKLFWYMNDFIIHSDFWEQYHKNKDAR